MTSIPSLTRGVHSCRGPKHSIYGDWRIDGKDCLLLLEDITDLLTVDKIVTIPHDEIGWKGYDLDHSLLGYNCACCIGFRYARCDPTIPPVIVEGASNPANRKYRLIDGKHRLQKRIITDPSTKESRFYVLQYSDIKDKLISF